jgi:hypothetical protein
MLRKYFALITMAVILPGGLSVVSVRAIDGLRLIQKRDSPVPSRGTTNLRQFPFGKIARHPAGKLPGALRVEPLAERDGCALEFLFPGIDERVENAVAVFAGSNRGEALGHKSEVVDLTQILADRFQLVVQFRKNSRR